MVREISADLLSVCRLNSTICPRKFSLSAPGGGEGWGEVGESARTCGSAHLTLPIAYAMGPLPLPPEGRRGTSGALLR